MRAMLFHNPKAGECDHEAETLIDALGAVGFDVSYCSTKSRKFSARLLEKTDLVIIAGGDGTVQKVVTEMSNRAVPIAILPFGTANNVARSLGTLGGAKELAEAVQAKRTHRLDIGLAAGPWGERRFVEATGFGCLAKSTTGPSSDKAAREKRLEHGRKFFARQLKKSEAMEVMISVDGRSLSGRWLFVEVLNTPFTGPALPLSPDAQPGDGVLDLVWLEEDRRADMMDWLAAPEKMPPPVQATRGRCIQFEWDRRRPLRLDDQSVEEAAEEGPALVTVQLDGRPFDVLVAPGAA